MYGFIANWSKISFPKEGFFGNQTKAQTQIAIYSPDTQACFTGVGKNLIVGNFYKLLGYN